MAKKDSDFLAGTTPLAPTNKVAILQPDGVGGFVNRLVDVQEIANLAASSGGGITVETKTAAFTPTLIEAKNYYRFDSGTAAACTIPTHADEPFALGHSFTFRQVGAGQLSVLGDTGVTITLPADLSAKTRTQHSSIAVVKIANDEWELTGDLEPL